MGERRRRMRSGGMSRRPLSEIGLVVKAVDGLQSRGLGVGPVVRGRRNVRKGRMVIRIRIGRGGSRRGWMRRRRRSVMMRRGLGISVRVEIGPVGIASTAGESLHQRPLVLTVGRRRRRKRRQKSVERMRSMRSRRRRVQGGK